MWLALQIRSGLQAICRLCTQTGTLSGVFDQTQAQLWETVVAVGDWSSGLALAGGLAGCFAVAFEDYAEAVEGEHVIDGGDIAGVFSDETGEAAGG